MQNIKTVAVIGASDKRNFTVLRELSERYQMLLFDKDPVGLSEIYDSLLANNHNVIIEKMACATDASWEADIIILSGYCINDQETIQRIKKVATAKIIIIMENDDEFTKSINNKVSFDLVFPHSKIVEIISLNMDENAEKEFLLEGHDSYALDSVSDIFERMGFNTYVSQLN
ncbi:hypothetical protein [Flavobacterium degerlachei]|jgi:hypothetical protein|uniref:Uncharacterized protein n=1 Tax=Flavobacterium degerlachei TaxID=229203 RepID=A0A1H3GER1_9FLAO|nr:hypothetical protein [Flavobacterium degerlachei]SDY01813.1 hypothetical protein SAMN05444338_12212 [Flavobacterium degerlachei]